MARLELKPAPLTREAFAPYGDVIETDGAKHFAINAGAMERFHDLAKIELGEQPGARPLINIFHCNRAAELPLPVKLVERHPLGSQAFIPLNNAPLLVVVAPAGESVAPEALRAFVSNGRQGVNYHPAVWHMPLIALRDGQQFLVVDRGGPGNNCDEFWFKDHDIVLTD